MGGSGTVLFEFALVNGYLEFQEHGVLELAKRMSMSVGREKPDKHSINLNDNCL